MGRVSIIKESDDYPGVIYGTLPLILMIVRKNYINRFVIVYYFSFLCEIRSNTYFYEEIHLFDSIITVL